MYSNPNFVLNGFKSDLYFTVNGNGVPICPKALRFSGGEMHITVPVDDVDKSCISSVEVFARLQDSDGVMALLMLTNALKIALSGCHNVYYTLNIGYFPYARQDRPCNPGEALSVKVMADLVNSLDYDRVTVTDPHSDVTPGLLHYCDAVSVVDIFMSNVALGNLVNWNIDALIIPDAGAAKKINLLASKFEIETIQCHKNRDTANGNITDSYFMGDVKGKDLLIVDDILDGGYTFICLAKLFKEHGAKSVTLYITHGIFSKGLEPVLEYIDEIYTTDTFNHGLEHENLHVIKI